MCYVDRCILTLAFLTLGRCNYLSVPVDREPTIIGSNIRTIKTIDDTLQWSWLVTDLTWNDNPNTS